MIRRVVALFLGLAAALPPMGALAEGEYPVDLAGCKAAVLIEQKSGAEVLDFSGGEEMEAGGLTRLPALLAVCRKIDGGGMSLEDTVTVSAAAARAQGPTAFLEANENAKVSALLKAAVVICAADAIYALGEAAYGSPEACSQAAGDILSSLGINRAYSLDEEGKYTAKELALIGAELMESDAFNLYSGIYYDSIEHEDGRLTELASSNKLLKNCIGACGVATGSSSGAGYCGVFGVKRGESSYVCALLGASGSSARAETAQSIIEYGFAAFDARTLARQGDVIAQAVPVRGGVISTVDLVAMEDAVALVPKGAQLSEEWRIPEELKAPLTKESSAGSVAYTLDGKAVATVELAPAQEVAKAAMGDYIKKALLEWLHG